MGPLTYASWLQEISLAKYMASGYVWCGYPHDTFYVLHVTEIQMVIRWMGTGM